MKIGIEVDAVRVEGAELKKKMYQEPKLVEHGQWTEETRPPVGSTP